MAQSSNKPSNAAADPYLEPGPVSGLVRRAAVRPAADGAAEALPSRRALPSRSLSSYAPASSSTLRSALPPAHHEGLSGGAGAAVSFRPARISAGEIPAKLVCRFRCEDVPVGPLAIIDVSAAGFAARAFTHPAIDAGTPLESLEVLAGDRVIWTGEAAVVRVGEERFAARFTSGLLDPRRLRLGAILEGRIELHREQRARLPVAWRAAVSDIRQMLENARSEIEDVERADSHDPLQRKTEEASLFEALRERWGALYFEAVAELHEMSKALDARAAALGRSYASSTLMPLLMPCPLHRRAYEKPLGYAGDYRMMEYCFAPEPLGEGLVARFLFSIAQSYTFVRTAVAREVVLRRALQRAAQAPGAGPVRILALAAGPAMELRRWLCEVSSLDRPVELFLLDQDRAAHEAAYRHLTRILLERHHGMLPVTVKCLHFSVRQLVSPRTIEEQRIVGETLSGLDLAYSTGLYDYLTEPVAQRLTRRLFALLRGGGRLLIGNLTEAPDTTWVMDYVLDWPIVYRGEQDMRRLGDGLGSASSQTGLTCDATGRCLFLTADKASWSA